MKLRSTTPVSKSLMLRAGLIAIVVILAVTIPVQYLANRSVSADEYDAQIQAIQRKVAGYEAEADALSKKADTLQNALNKLSNEKAKLQTQIDLYQKQHDKLVQEIEDTEKQIDENRETSGELIVTSTVSSDVPLIVRLAASDNLADYIEGEASLNSVRDTIVQKTEENERLKAELIVKRDEVKDVLNDQEAAKALLTQKQSEQAAVLRETKGNEAQYQKLIKKGEDEINSLVQQQQQAAQAALQNVGGGGSSGALSSTNYQWASAATNYDDNCRYPTGLSGADKWGYCVRQCTSYVAWKLDKDGKSGFSGMGHASNWWGLPGISAGSVRKGDVIVSPAGGYGHVMYVEGVSGGMVSYTDYNGAGGPVSPGQGTLPLSTATNNSSYKVIRF